MTFAFLVIPSPGPTKELDYIIFNKGFSLFPHASVNHFPHIGSDHSPILLNTSTYPNVPKPFRFENMWLDDNTCFDTVQKGWNKSVSCSSQFKLHSRIKNVKQFLKDWNLNHFGNCYKKIKDIQIQIEKVQLLENFYTNNSLDLALQVELDMWLQRIETFWKQKAKDKWLMDGDSNTRYFHLTTIINARHNRIISIKNMNNLVFYDRNSIGNCFVNFYKTLFTSSYASSSLPYPDNLDNLFSLTIENQDISNLTSIPTPMTMKKTLFSFADNKSPGPDGLPPTFYKNFWNTNKFAVIEATQNFFRTGHILKALNSSFIALIRKSKNASRVDHYRPISLCNLTYKIISKILADRIKAHLKKCISPFQMAFISGRNIHDYVIISHEIMHYLHLKVLWQSKLILQQLLIELNGAFSPLS